MASILLSYVDSDKPAAATLAKLLEGAGHLARSTSSCSRTITPIILSGFPICG
jgi:hypothetical protein